MDNVHKPHEKSYISEKFSVCEFLQQWLDVLDVTGEEEIDIKKGMPILSKISESMNVDMESVEKLSQVCGIENLDCENENTIEYLGFSNLPPGVDLSTSKFRREEIKKWAYKKWFQSQVVSSRYQFCNQELYYNMRSNAHPKIQNEIKGPDVVLSIQIYKPIKDFHTPSNLKSNFRLESEICVLGRQPLTRLRDKIYCTSDYTIPDDLSNEPSVNFEMNKKSNNSGFLYINGVFYNDTRNPQNIDYSEVIRNWSLEKERKIGPFQTNKMEATCFGELTIRMGYPYVYQHQGQCEHLFAFTDVRMLSEDDCQDLSAYPLTKCISPKKSNKCMICHQVIAKWVTVGNERVPENPFFFCENCYFSFNYKGGKKIGNFKAYHYVDRSSLP